MFIDIHTHPTLKPFTNNGNIFIEHKNNQKSKNVFHKLVKSIISLLTKDIPKHSQSHFQSLIQGNFNIIITSFFALEKEFFNTKILPKKLDLPLLSHLTGVPENKVTLDYYNFIYNEMLWLKEQEKNNTQLYNFVIAKNYSHIERIHRKNPKTLCVIPSIEGIQCLLTYDELKNPNKELLLSRLDSLPLKPFFITFNHHFWNGLSSNADSVQSFLFTQKNEFKGISPLGLEIIDSLIERGILIDIKHFDGDSRRDFYNHIRGKNIPIICSHTGISTWENLSDIKDDHKRNKKSFFHELEINICGEDVREIVNSGGLIGIQMDKKRLVGSRVKITEDNVTEVIIANILKCVEFGGIQTWNHISIGSDFDGMITHLPGLLKSEDFPKLYFEILNFLICPKDILFKGDLIYSKEKIDSLIGGRYVKELVDRIFGLNAKEFLKRNFF